MRSLRLVLMIVSLLSINATGFAVNAAGVNGDGNGNEAVSVGSAKPMWEFYSCTYPPSAEQLADVEDDYFGKTNTYFYNKLQGMCVKRIPVVPGDPTTRLVVKKGDLLDAVKRVRNTLEKAVDRKLMTEVDASSRMERVLGVAIAAFYSEDSRSFERELHVNRKDGNALLATFERVELK